MNRSGPHYARTQSSPSQRHCPSTRSRSGPATRLSLHRHTLPALLASATTHLFRQNRCGFVFLRMSCWGTSSGGRDRKLTLEPDRGLQRLVTPSLSLKLRSARHSHRGCCFQGHSLWRELRGGYLDGTRDGTPVRPLCKCLRFWQAGRGDLLVLGRPRQASQASSLAS